MLATDRLGLALGRGPVVLDAAIGTRLIAWGLDLARDDPSLWVVDHPDVVRDLHRRDVASGSDAVLTNTFGANRAWLARFNRGGEVATINARAVALAREAAGPERLVIGAIGPTASADEARRQADALITAGADALVLETHLFEAAMASLASMRSAGGPPVIASLFAWPEHVADAARRLEDAGAAALGVNCVVGMAEAVRVATQIRAATSLPVWLEPSAGLPADEPESPGVFAGFAAALVGLGPVLVGGCCGTTEAHIAALRAGVGAVAGRGRGR